MDPSQNPRVFSERYELNHLIARGGMAEVYRAHDRLLDRPVALKVLFPELSVDRSFVERFRREAQAAANLSDPNIVPVFDWGEDTGTYFIVMDFIDGRPLSSILKTAGPLSAERSADVGAHVAAALGYAHKHGVIHRDVKPGNVLITDEGRVKVTDFGIARAINTEESLTQTGAVMGTATYFSPEQAEGIGVDARSDLYSLGVVLFEMVTGRPPFMGDTPVAVASKHVRENPPTPREINPSVPPDLEAIILKCLAKSPEYRYATGDDLRVDLLRFREGRAVGAVAPPMMAPPTMGTTQAIPFSGTQTLAQIPGLDQEEPEPSRTGLYAVILVVLLAALAVVILFLGQSLGWWHIGSGNSTVTITDLTGQTVTAAEQTLHQQGLKYTVHSDPTSSASNKKVIRTTPAAGTKVKAGSTVELITGGSGSLILIPSYQNFSTTQASAAVRALGLQPKVEPTVLCSQQNINIVCSQSPKAGAHLAPGKTVTLFTASTQATTTTTATTAVPPVVGDTQTQACNVINGAGFQCGSTSTTPSNLPVNAVVSTNPTSGSQQPKGTTINLVLSSGPSSVVVQSVVGDTQATAETTLQGQGLTVVVNCQATSDSSQDGIVQSQTPAGGQPVSLPASVTITVDNLSGCGTSSTTTTTG